MYEVLSDKDKALISRYIEYYGPNQEYYSDASYNERASLDYILRHWDKEKEDLYQLLGCNFTIERHVHLDSDISLIARKLSDMHSSPKQLRDTSYSDIIQHFYSWIWAVSRCHYNWFYFNQKDNKNLSNALTICDDWFDYEALARNTYDGKSGIMYFPDSDKPYQVKHGMRITRLLERIRKAYGDVSLLKKEEQDWFYDRIRTFTEEDLAKLIDLIAIARSTTNSEFDICLSIHPLDYMTMSDNDMGWTSCMSWKDHSGDYRLGTVECMNSPTVLVAYIKDSKPMDLGFDNQTWVNKTWRQLFLVDRESVVAVKGYPFQHDGAVSYVLDWIRELAQKYWAVNFDFSGYITDNGGHVFKNDGELLTFTNEDTTIAPSLEAKWCFMYDDLGTLSKHKVLLNTKDLSYSLIEKDDSYHAIRASGVSECMWCGGEMVESYADDFCSTVFCLDCAPLDEDSNCSCDWCGERHVELDYVADLDAYLCEDCYADHTVRDTITDRVMWEDNCQSVYIVLGKNSETDELATADEPLYLNYETDYYPEEKLKWFKDANTTAFMASSVSIGDSHWHHKEENLIFFQDLSEEAQEWCIANLSHWNKNKTFEENLEYYNCIPISDEEVTNYDRETAISYDNEERETVLQRNGITRQIKYWWN